MLTLSLVQGCFALCLVIAPFGCILASTASTVCVIAYGAWGWRCGRQKSWSHSPRRCANRCHWSDRVACCTSAAGGQRCPVPLPARMSTFSACAMHDSLMIIARWGFKALLLYRLSSSWLRWRARVCGGWPAAAAQNEQKSHQAKGLNLSLSV